MDDKHKIQGSRAQLKKSMEEEYGKIIDKKPANENVNKAEKVNANELAAILKAVYNKNKKKARLVIRSWKNKKAA